MRELIEMMASALVDEPQNISVLEIEGGSTNIFELRVSKDDKGKVIGRQGRTAEAMRTILNAVSAKDKKRSVLEII